MEKLLNFSEPIDVTLLDGVVESLYGPDPRAVCLLSSLSAHHLFVLCIIEVLRDVKIYDL